MRLVVELRDEQIVGAFVGFLIAKEGLDVFSDLHKGFFLFELLPPQMSDAVDFFLREIFFFAIVFFGLKSLFFVVRTKCFKCVIPLR